MSREQYFSSNENIHYLHEQMYALDFPENDNYKNFVYLKKDDSATEPKTDSIIEEELEDDNENKGDTN